MHVAVKLNLKFKQETFTYGKCRSEILYWLVGSIPLHFKLILRFDTFYLEKNKQLHKHKVTHSWRYHLDSIEHFFLFQTV